MHCWLWLAWWISSWPYLFLLKHPLHKAPGGMIVTSVVFEHLLICFLWNGNGEGKETKEIQKWLHFPSFNQTWVWKWWEILDAKTNPSDFFGAVFRFRWDRILKTRDPFEIQDGSATSSFMLETYTKHVKKINLSPMPSTNYIISYSDIFCLICPIWFFGDPAGDAAPLKALSYCVWCVWWNPYGRFGWCEVCTSSEVFEAWRHMKLPTLDPWMVDLPTFSIIYLHVP